MKKMFFAIFALFIFSYGKSQIISEIKQYTGLSISSVYFYDDHETGGTFLPYNGIRYKKNLLSVSTGFQVSYLKHKFWQLNSRLYYFERGGSEKLELVDPYYNKTGEYELNRFSANYLSFNTTFEIKQYTKIANPYIFLGPRFDILVSRNWRNLNEYNYGFDLGSGIEKSIKNKYLIGIDLLYSYQIRSISDSYWEYIYSIKPQKGITVLLTDVTQN